MKYLFVLGREQNLSLAEIFAVAARERASTKLLWRADEVACIEIKGADATFSANLLSGVIKIAHYIDEGTIKTIEDEIVKDLIGTIPTPKKIFGVSCYGTLPITNNKLGQHIKKSLVEQGHSARFVTGKEEVLNAATVIHNDLIKKGAEYLVVPYKTHIALGRTISVQDIEEWGKRDFTKPVRDSRRGMLPPKLARMMVHLSSVPVGATILDPFCGTGTVAMEALTLGFKVVASDADPDAFTATKENIQWFQKEYSFSHPPTIIQADARTIASRVKEKVDAIVTEPFLGNEHPLTKPQRTEEIKKLLELYTKSLNNWKKILNVDGVVVMVVPSFMYRDEVLTVPLTSMLPALGYALAEMPESLPNPLRYMREGQRIAREIYLLKKS